LVIEISLRDLLRENFAFYRVRRGDLFVTSSVKKTRNLTIHESEAQRTG